MAEVKKARDELREAFETKFLQLLSEMEAAGLIVHDKDAEPKPLLKAELNGSSFVLAQADAEKIRSLSRRQAQVGCHLGEGRGDKGIARLFKLKAGTVSNQLKLIRAKLGVRSRAGIARYWLWLNDL